MDINKEIELFKNIDFCTPHGSNDVPNKRLKITTRNSAVENLNSKQCSNVNPQRRRKARSNLNRVNRNGGNVHFLT